MLLLLLLLSIMEISSPAVRKILNDNAKSVTHTVVPEKHRLRDDNKNRVFEVPTSTGMGPLGHHLIFLLVMWCRAKYTRYWPITILQM